MMTKGIRRGGQGGESHYTVKSEGATCWEEGDLVPLTLHLGQRASPPARVAGFDRIRE